MRAIWGVRRKWRATRNILPAALTGEVIVTILLAVVGFALIWTLNQWAARRKEAEAA